MKTSVRILALALFLLPNTSSAECRRALQGQTYFSPRSQGLNGARTLSGTALLNNRQEPYYNHDIFGSVSVIPMYQRSYSPHRLADYFFGNDTLTIRGSQTGERADQDILADYFGLSPAFESEILFEPKVTNAIADFNAYINADALYCGLYAMLSVPYVSTRWCMNMSESIITDGSATPFPALYMSQNALAAPLKSFTQALATGATYGDVTEPLAFGRISPCPLKLKKFADIHLKVGWDFMRKERAHVGFNGIVVIPTGNRSTAEFLFEPIIGNGHHLEYGAGIYGHFVLWESGFDRSLALHASLDITHLHETKSVRSFDFRFHPADAPFKCSAHANFASRYMLLKIFDPATGIYTGQTVPAINRTTFTCSTNYGGQVEGVCMLTYKQPNFDANFGYNLWIRSRERLNICNLNKLFPANTYAYKGIQDVRTAGPGFSPATESTATIVGNDYANQALFTDPASPVFLTFSDLDLQSAVNPGVFSHTFFGHIGYAWCTEDHDRMHPYIGLGGSIEFDGLRTGYYTNEIALPQWGIWGKLGVAF